MEKYSDEDPNSDIIGQITGYMRVGADFILASAACGITERKAIEWQEKAAVSYEANNKDIYQDLFEGIRSSLAHAEVIALQRLSAEGGASGAKWLLEKMNPEKYGKPQSPKLNEWKADTVEGWEAKSE